MITTKKIKICFIIQSLAKGGAEKIVATVAENINHDIFETYIILIEKDKILYQIENSRIIEINVNMFYFSIFSIYKEINKIQPDIIFSTLTRQNAYIGLFRFLFSSKIKFIARESTIPAKNSEKFFFKKFINFYIENTYKNFDIFISQSLDMTKDLVDSYRIQPNKIVNILNPIDIDFLEHSNLKTTYDNREIIRFISVGNLREVKGFNRLILILSELNINYECIILGEGAERKNLENLISKLNLGKKIILMGEVENPFKFLITADVYLQTSHFEGLPNALIEAQAIGLPSIAFDCPGGTKEVIIDGLTGFLVENNNEALFIEKIKQSLSFIFDKDKIKNHIKNKFNKKKIISQYEETFLSIIKM